VLHEENVQRYAKGLYPVALLLIVVPVTDIALRAFPPQFGTLQWRFATVGLLLGNYGTILLGLGLLGLVAALLAHRGVLRGIGLVCLLLAVVTLAVLVLFGLDAIQIRRLAQPGFKRQILTSSLGALFTGTVGAVALATLGRAALAASRGGRAATATRKAASPLVVGGVAAPVGASPVGASAGATSEAV
jgi:hypothetical protein